MRKVSGAREGPAVVRLEAVGTRGAAVTDK